MVLGQFVCTRCLKKGNQFESWRVLIEAKKNESENASPRLHLEKSVYDLFSFYFLIFSVFILGRQWRAVTSSQWQRRLYTIRYVKVFRQSNVKPKICYWNGLENKIPIFLNNICFSSRRNRVVWIPLRCSGGSGRVHRRFSISGLDSRKIWTRRWNSQLNLQQNFHS